MERELSERCDGSNNGGEWGKKWVKKSSRLKETAYLLFKSTGYERWHGTNTGALWAEIIISLTQSQRFYSCVSSSSSCTSSSSFVTLQNKVHKWLRWNHHCRKLSINYFHHLRRSILDKNVKYLIVSASKIWVFAAFLHPTFKIFQFHAGVCLYDTFQRENDQIT